MHKAAVMGDYDSIYGFSSLGLDIFPITEVEEAAQLLKRLAGGEYAIIYITESLAEKIDNVIERYREQVTPAIILIPGVSGNTGEGMSSVMKSIERAVGSQILD